MNRGEDDLVAFSWAKYLNNTDTPEWIIFLPMAKAAVRAMDTVEAFLAAGVDGYQADVKRWAVAGASKRGWSTWLTAAVVPDRIHAMVPVVFDLLNFTPNIHHMYENYGGWSWALGPYVSEGIMSFLDSPAMDLWTNITDPIAYAERLTMPKLVVNSGMDEFFMPDDTHWWWNKMPEPKHFLMTPNTDHICATGVLETIPAIGSFIKSVLNDKPAPTFTWKID
jgi:PhoPQ-activated pathogenicity-related protein